MEWWQVVAAVVVIVFVVGVAMGLPDILRYLRIRRM